jgi:ABC-type glycerol-3-phosphate transport system substrate-binding protein
MMRIGRLVLTVAIITALFASVASAQIELVVSEFSGNAPRHEWLNMVAQEFMAQNPNVTVTVIQAGKANVMQMYAAGSAPDISWLGQSWGDHLGQLVPLEDFIEADPDFLDLFMPSTQGLFQFDGHTWAIIMSTPPRAVFYNTEILARLGYNEPSNKWTWDEAIEMMKAATRDTDGDGYADEFGYNEWWQPWDYLAYDGLLYADDMRTSRVYTPLRLTAAQLFQDIHSGALGFNSSSGQDLFNQGKLAFMNQGVYDIAAVRGNTSFDWNVQILPLLEYEGKLYYGAHWLPEEVIISNQSKYPELCWEFIKFMYSDEMYEQLAATGEIMPVTQAGVRAFMYQPTPPENLMAFIETMGVAISNAMHPAFGQMFSMMYQPIWNAGPPHDGSLPMEQILRESHEAIQAALDAFYAGYDAR